MNSSRRRKSLKNQLFHEYRRDPDNAHNDARLFTPIIRRREKKIVSVPNKITEIEVS